MEETKQKDMETNLISQKEENDPFKDDLDDLNMDQFTDDA